MFARVYNENSYLPISSKGAIISFLAPNDRGNMEFYMHQVCDPKSKSWFSYETWWSRLVLLDVACNCRRENWGINRCCLTLQNACTRWCCALPWWPMIWPWYRATCVLGRDRTCCRRSTNKPTTLWGVVLIILITRSIIRSWASFFTRSRAMSGARQRSGWFSFEAIGSKSHPNSRTGKMSRIHAIYRRTLRVRGAAKGHILNRGGLWHVEYSN